VESRDGATKRVRLKEKSNGKKRREREGKLMIVKEEGEINPCKGRKRKRIC
jgi:hypothetical protein